MKILSAVLQLLGLLLVSGCTANAPFRTLHSLSPPSCEADPVKQENPDCSISTSISTSKYDVLFVEFDDLGLLHPRKKPYRSVIDASTCQDDIRHAPSSCFEHPQINQLMMSLDAIAEKAGSQGLSIVLFAHGWKHNAHHDDKNLHDFRRQLSIAAQVEAMSTKRRVVGIYLGWRGSSLSLPLVQNITFWDRKAVAERVAEGSAIELLSRLHGFWDWRNRLSASEKLRRGEIRFILIGHSFGGLVLFNALSHQLVNALTRRPGQTAGPDRFFDMVVLLNPAFHATRWVPIHRVLAAQTDPWQHYAAPLLVLITADSDWATRIAFQFGRALNSVFESELGQEEADINKKTPGHVLDYVTYTLERTDNGVEPCEGWKPAEEISDPAKSEEQTKINLDVENKHRSRYFDPYRQPNGEIILPVNWARSFCGGARVVHQRDRLSPHSPVWNVRVTDKEIINGHNDIAKPILTNLLRQLYVDSIRFPSR